MNAFDPCERCGHAWINHFEGNETGVPRWPCKVRQGCDCASYVVPTEDATS